MNRPRLTFVQRIGLELLWLLARAVAVMPYWVKYYVIENLLFVLLFYCLRYRRRVVTENLRGSFPEKSEAELRTIRRRFYRTLAEVVVDTVNMAHMTRGEGPRGCGRGQSGGAPPGGARPRLDRHDGPLRLLGVRLLLGRLRASQLLISVYHPLRSPVAERFYQRLRNYENATAVSMKESLRFYLRHCEQGIDGKNLVMGLICDQNPPLRPDSHWFRFLNRDTVFFDGGEKLALRCHLPVYFMRMERVQRGRYRMWFERIYDGEEQVAPNEITERYVRRLEAQIVEHPELWIWSHRRWKHKRADGDR